MNLKAIELFNILKEYTEEELREMDIVIEIGRKYKNIIGDCPIEYANLIDEMEGQIRLIYLNDKNNTK